MALRSITAVLSTQKQLEGVVQYLRTNGQQVDSLCLECRRSGLSLHQLPSNLQISSLKLTGFSALQLQPGSGFQGVLGPAGAATLKQLHLEDCQVIDSEEEEAALSQLPAGLEALTLTRVTASYRRPLLDADALEQLQQLTCLHLAGIESWRQASPALTCNLQVLTTCQVLKACQVLTTCQQCSHN
jgi:hypothetical protein